MKTKQFVRILALLMLVFAGASVAYASQTAIESKSMINLHAEGEYLYETFAISVPEAGDYYPEFWLRPARHLDGSFTTFRVLVNGKYVSDITPLKGNWQSIGLDMALPVTLNKGVNLITIGSTESTPSDVEKVRVARDERAAIIDGTAYGDYLSLAKQQANVEKVMEKFSIDNFTQSSGPIKSAVTKITPLTYTYFNFVYVLPGRSIDVTSISETEHVIEIMRLGDFNPRYLDLYLPLPGTTITEEDSIYYRKVSHSIEYVDDATMQSNGQCVYSKPGNATKHIAHWGLESAIGYYLIRVRPVENGTTGTAMVILNNSSIYDDCPISYNTKPTPMAANGKKYATYTEVDTDSGDDPILIIYSGEGTAEKPIGFADDYGKDKNELGISREAAYIEQQYIEPATHSSISNYYSSDPASSCKVRYADIVE